jgi:hypothetical protein
MKTNLILGSLLAFIGTANAQFSTAPAPAPILSGGQRIGINNSGPQSEVDIFTYDPTPSAGGISVAQKALTGSAALHLASHNTQGETWSIYSLGNSNHIGGSSNRGDFAIYNQNNNFTPFLISKSTGNVGINTTNPFGKLHVVQTQAPTGGYFTALGAYGGAVNTTGLYAQTTGWNLSTSALNIGLAGDATSGSASYGLAFGVRGYGYLTKWVYGGHFSANGAGGEGCGEAYGIYATASGACSNWAGYFSGNVIASSYQTFSDEKLKKNIAPLSGALEKIKLLKPSTYSYKTEEFGEMNLPEGDQMGLIAQDLEKVFPGLIKSATGNAYRDPNSKAPLRTEGFKSVNYIGLIPVLISAVQEQQERIEKQDALIAQLLEKSGTSNGTTSGLHSQNGNLSDLSMAQNEPNPFTHETTIKYTLPASINNAYMAVYDLSGKQITSIPVTEKGSASLTITSEKLAAGIYIYTIVADGKVVDSRKMIVSEK